MGSAAYKLGMGPPRREEHCVAVKEVNARQRQPPSLLQNDDNFIYV